MAQILLALDHAHAKGVIHRDVKPANILCPSATSIKVADFGVARLDSLDLTKPGGLGAVGTPNYMAPERFLGRAADVRTDIFSAGVILFQLLTGAKPFVATELPELMRKLLNEDAPAVTTLRPELWSEIDGVVHQALARNPEDRFQSAEHFVEALNAAIECRPHENALPLDLTKLSRTVEEALVASPNKDKAAVTMASQLSIGAVDALSRSLGRWLGPIARLLVKQALQTTNDVDALLASLSAQIKSDVEVKLFRQAAEKVLRDDLGLVSARAQETISDAEIKAATEALVSVLGPVARHLVVREARTAVGRDDFYRRLAERAPDERAKTRVLELRNRYSQEA
jgi:eukaryotic-like serine/threonine-protein kinase